MVALSSSPSTSIPTTPTILPRSNAFRRCACNVSITCLLHISLTLDQIYHPNVDLEGNVCLNILREDWKPVLNLNSVMVGLQYLFLEPNADDPLNKGLCHISSVQALSLYYVDAAAEMSKNREQFSKNVKAAMRGGYIKGITYDNVTH
jgi:hypothetical protein